MDDISTLEQMSATVAAKTRAPLQAARSDPARRRAVDSVAVGGGGGGPAAVTPENAPIHPTGENPPTGVVVQYWLKGGGEDVGLEFLDATGKLIRSYSSKQDSAAATVRRSPADDGFAAAAAAARREQEWRQHLPLEHALPGRVELSRE